jgi:hypothetical protein
MPNYPTAPNVRNRRKNVFSQAGWEPVEQPIAEPQQAGVPVAPIPTNPITELGQMDARTFNRGMFRNQQVAGQIRRQGNLAAQNVHNARYNYPVMQPNPAASPGMIPQGPPNPNAAAMAAPMAPVPVPTQDLSAEMDLSSGGYFSRLDAQQGAIDVGMANAQAPMAVQQIRSQGDIARQRIETAPIAGRLELDRTELEATRPARLGVMQSTADLNGAKANDLTNPQARPLPPSVDALNNARAESLSRPPLPKPGTYRPITDKNTGEFLDSFNTVTGQQGTTPLPTPTTQPVVPQLTMPGAFAANETGKVAGDYPQKPDLAAVNDEWQRIKASPGKATPPAAQPPASAAPSIGMKKQGPDGRMYERRSDGWHPL